MGVAGDSTSAQSYQPPPAEDYSNFSWSQAFDKLHEKFSREYAFTEWKSIDWKALYKKFKPRIDKAQESKNFDDYYVALRAYGYSIPDNHIDISQKPDIDEKYIGGGFGFSVTKLSDGKIIASWVNKTGPAYLKGMRLGSEIIKWGDKLVADALKETSIIFGRSNPATEEGQEYEKARYLTRAPVGDKIKLSFKNIGKNGEQNIMLTAYDDKGQSLSKSYPYTIISDGIREALSGIPNPGRLPEAMIEEKILDEENIGYIRIWGEVDLDLKSTGTSPSTLKLFKDALAKFKARNVVGIILDVRNNLGGSDMMVTEILSPFYEVKTFYEYQNYINPKNSSWEIWVSNETPGVPPPYINPNQGLDIEPSLPSFRVPVVAITNTKCTSSGEGIAMGIKNLPNGETVGFYGTNGSFGMTGDTAIMPGDGKNGNIEIKWPFGQSLDKDKKVQLDSRKGKGGVSPSIRTPMTLDNALKVTQGEDVELEHAKRIISANQPDITQKLSEYLKKAVEVYSIPGLAVGVVKDGELVYESEFGKLDIKEVETISSVKQSDKGEITSKTLFHMASITKVFTAIAVLQLVEEKSIKLEDPLIKHLIYFKLNDSKYDYKKITIGQLLSHTSGLGDIKDYEWDRPRYDNSALEEYVRSLKDAKNDLMIAKPGTIYSYSNIGYDILGALIAKKSGMSYEEYVRMKILEPLDMSRSSQLYEGVDKSNLAQPHIINDDYKVAVSKVFPYNRKHTPSSILYSNVQDMSNFTVANLNKGEFKKKQILKPETYDLMWNPEVPLGWAVQGYRGEMTVSKEGRDIGFHSQLVLVPNAKLAVIAISNCDFVDIQAISNAAIDIYLGYKVQLPSEKLSIKVDPKIFDSYVGQYKYKGEPSYLTVDVSRNTDRLFFKISLVGFNYELFPESKTKYFIKYNTDTVEFKNSPNGSIEMIFNLDGEPMEFEKLPAKIN